MDTSKIREHYDILSPYYAALWDKHIHHGYYLTGDESKARATQQLIDLLLSSVDLPPNAKVLDIGCGIGATAIYFAQEHDWQVTGLTLSPEQAQIARRAAQDMRRPPTFIVQDANDLQVPGEYDLIWTVEMLSHLNRRAHLFQEASKRLKPGGYWCIAAWMKASNLTDEKQRTYIDPIEHGMLVDLPTKEEYLEHFQTNDLSLKVYHDISANVAKTWDLSVAAITNPRLWQLAAQHGGELVEFLRSFKAMQAGFRSGCFRYVAIVVQK